jgi:short-subunit dehydrogenase
MNPFTTFRAAPPVTIFIGYELAKLFARDRYNLVLVARNRDTLEQFVTELQAQFGISARAVALDLTVASAPQLLFNSAQAWSFSEPQHIEPYFV